MIASQPRLALIAEENRISLLQNPFRGGIPPSASRERVRATGAIFRRFQMPSRDSRFSDPVCFMMIAAERKAPVCMIE